MWSVTCKLFADIERLRVREEANKAEERKRKAEETTEREERLKLRKEWDKNYEVICEKTRTLSEFFLFVSLGKSRNARQQLEIISKSGQKQRASERQSTNIV